METLPIFLCVLYQYNHAYAAGLDTDDPEWMTLHTRYVQARNLSRAELVFRLALRKELVFMPSPVDQQVQMMESTEDYAEFEDWEKKLYPLVVDTDESQEIPFFA